MERERRVKEDEAGPRPYTVLLCFVLLALLCFALLCSALLSSG